MIATAAFTVAGVVLVPALAVLLRQWAAALAATLQDIDHG